MRSVRGDPMTTMCLSAALALGVLAGLGTGATHAATTEKPAPELTLHFTKGSAEAPLTMMSPFTRHVIWCDMHPDVKGELFIIERRGG